MSSSFFPPTRRKPGSPNGTFRIARPSTPCHPRANAPCLQDSRKTKRGYQTTSFYFGICLFDAWKKFQKYGDSVIHHGTKVKKKHHLKHIKVYRTPPKSASPTCLIGWFIKTTNLFKEGFIIVQSPLKGIIYEMVATGGTKTPWNFGMIFFSWKIETPNMR